MGYAACVVMLAGAVLGVASMALGLLLGYRLAKGAEPVFGFTRIASAEPEEREAESEEFEIARR